MRKNVTQYRLPANADLTNPQHVDTLNKILQNLGDRLDTVQQIGANKPSTPQGVVVEGKQGLFNVVWNRIQNVDGYIVTWSTAAGMVPLLGRYTLHDSDAANYRLPVGNVAVTYFFTVSAFTGNKVSSPSNAVSASTIAYTTSGSAPVNAPVSPRAALVAVPRNGTTLP